MWRRSLIILAVLVGLGAGIAIALKSDRVAANLEAYLVRVAAERFGATLTLETLTVELLPPGLTLERIVTIRAATGEPWLTAHRARVSLRPWPSSTGALVIDHLELDGLRGTLDLRRPAVAEPAAPAAPPQPNSVSEGPRMSVDIGDLLVWNTDLTVLFDEGALTVRRTDLTVSQSLRGRQLALNVPDAEVNRPTMKLAFETHLRGELLGSFDRPAGIEIERSWLALEQATASAHGHIDLEGTPTFDLELRGRAPLSRLFAALGQQVPLEGALAVEGSVVGPLTAPHGQARVTLSDASFEGRRLGQVQLEGAWSHERLQLDSVRVDHPTAGAVTGSATVELQRSLPLTFAARLHRVSLPHVLDSVGLPDTWVPLQLSGDVRGHGTFIPFRLDLDLGGSIDNFAVRDRSYQANDPFLVLVLPQVDIQGGAEITARGVHLRSIKLSRLSSLVNVEGSLNFDFERGLDLHAASEKIYVGDVGDIAGIPFAGRGAVGATIEGPYEQPTISGTAALDEFGVGGFALGDIKGTLVVRDGVMTIERADVRRGNGLLQARGTLDLGADVPQVRGYIDLDQIGATDLLTTLGVSPTLADRLDSKLSGEVELHGLLERPDGTFALASPRLSVDGHLLGGVKLNGGFSRHRTPIWGSVVLEREAGELTTSAAWHEEGTVRLEISTAALPLPLVRPFFADLALDGQLTGTLALEGPPEALSGDISIQVEDLAVVGLRLERTALTAKLERGTLTISGTALSGDASLDATFRLGHQLPFTATATFRELAVDRLLALPADLRLTCTGTTFAEGDLTRPAGVLADLRLDRAAAVWEGMAAEATRPVRLHWANGQVVIDDLALAGSGAELSAAGSVSANGELDLILRGAGDLKTVGGGGQMRWLRGRLELDSRLRGTTAAPSLTGFVTVKNGALRLTSIDEPFDNLNARIAFAGRTATLESGSANWSGGRLALGGRMLLPSAGGSDLDLRATVTNVSLRPQPDLSATLSGELNLVGPLDDLLLRGRIKLDSLQYTANLDLDRLIPRRNAPPLRVPAFDPDRAVRLAVGVVAPNNILLSSTMAEAEFRVDVTVTGTTERVGLVGTATPLWGRARYGTNEFVVERGTIDFVDEFRIATEFDLRATTQACDMRIAVDVHGNSSQYNIVPRGQDQNGPVSPEDVFTCLSFGVRRTELEERMLSTETQGDEANALTSTVLASGLDTLWAVSGMDVKVRQLLPIKLDQVRLESGWSTHFRRSTTRVVLGKELGANLQLRYARSLDEIDDQTFAVEYQLSDVAAMQGTWISASNVSLGDFGLDLRLRWEFR